jgi:hypothetical protein
MSERAIYTGTIADTAETVGGELKGGMLDAILDLHNGGQVSIAEVAEWYRTGELSDTAKAALAATACQAA